MLRRKVRRRLSAAALLPLLGLSAACSDAGSPAGTAEAADRKPVATETRGHAAPLTAAELKAALLTEAEATGFTITGSDSRVGAAAADARAAETGEPAACLVLRRTPSQNAPERGESASAWSTMYLGDGALWPRQTVLTSYPVDTARARMAELRRAVAACGRFHVRNAYGTGSVTTEILPVSALGDEAVRYRMLDRSKLRSGDLGYSYALVTVVRAGGVIASVRTSDVFGPFPVEQVKRFAPEPGPDEPMTAALAEKVSKAAGA
ncbi:hypothetical protein [Streptomyces sp. NBC_00059]|uniref:hypothetical protein n=1 Tax=Streptomyces sp. NBC_00059 TaxID=2975635 RepID=UPI00225B441E|nr:hypothetical protein [Streptomyces sp. NBC_00059]MCX5416076.1 hypothetical protein [Streptomyces sp. NBC_00059]